MGLHAMHFLPKTVSIPNAGLDMTLLMLEASVFHM